MNKWCTLLAGSAMLGGFLFASASADASPLSVFVNGQYQNKPITSKGRTLVKLRALTDPAWLEFAYDPKTHIVMFHTKDNSITVQLREGNKTAMVNGKQVKIDAAVVNKDGLTYVPLRFISETLGAYVNYYPDDNHVIVRTPSAQAKYETLMHGDLTAARKIALGLTKVRGEAPRTENGEMYNYYYYTFPEGEALRFTFDESGFSDSYYEVNEEGLAVLKWQIDNVANRNWGTKPVFKNRVYFLNEFLGGVFTYGTLDSQGNNTQLGRFSRNEGVLPIEGEKRTDARP
ncbi:copper amine oxidase N-terminal domain-containing protein [Paenibacillus nasutitermitis]|uniref:Copper amine oxidase-like N-terminal domain-containing protein n=1 Tax=Paenibacillus nasutitermitis TaxID=1652958 RepID=A0A917E4J5_9BACL|nr:copper amine oxidase N-terminal domain-containing protein [Paenibacillus nasutitermitis]GGE02931.1 hypothetical protein GCM10010911_72480 [Paenibacillus nasutitermitis]